MTIKAESVVPDEPVRTIQANQCRQFTHKHYARYSDNETQMNNDNSEIISLIVFFQDWLETFLAKVKANVKRNNLSKADQITYDVPDDTIQTWLDGYEWKKYGVR
ncbi:hypothetical protein DPMN_000755 [Dreissena polymorpha]|uniref:Uncharacterized protein n=1 Tax=Dreissena polymorpha TaxID=45954 RepID=A0A9D4MH98_DREPO|nr:hypothetical protein DPMN_000755 [Dreissena polymorpha]